MLRDLEFVFQPFVECIFELRGRNNIDIHLLLHNLRFRANQECKDTESKDVIDFIQNTVLCNFGLSLIRCSDVKSRTLGQHYIQHFIHDCCIDTTLAIAGQYVMEKNYQHALEILSKVESNLQYYTDYPCAHMHCTNHRDYGLQLMMFRKKPSIHEFCKLYCVAPVEYKKDNVTHVPLALQYEMFRTTPVCPKVTDYFMEWYQHAVIHCPVYLQYLRFLCFHALENHNDCRTALDNMVTESQKLEDKQCPHTETNHNVIGHCYATLGNVESAFKEFSKSLKMQSHHNAAIWHLCVLIYNTMKCNIIYSRM